MNGINETLSLKEKIAKEKQFKKYSTYKFVISLICSNLFVYFACQTKKDETILPISTIHDGYNEILIEAKNNVGSPNHNQKISIVDNKGQIIYHDAYFVEEINSNNADNYKYKIEIQKKENNKAMTLIEKKLYIVPYFTEININKKNKENSYEISI